MRIPCKIPCAHLAWEQVASRESPLHGARVRMDADGFLRKSGFCAIALDQTVPPV